MLNFSMPGRQNGKVMEVDFFNWGSEKLSEIEIANREKFEIIINTCRQPNLEGKRNN